MRLIIIIFLIILIIIFILFKFNHDNMTFIKADIDNNYYLVRDLYDKYIAANLLAQIKKNISFFIDVLYENRNEKYKEYKEYIERLKNNIIITNIFENANNNSDTSFSINKGEDLVICLRSRENHKYNQFEDMNIVMYVILHELSHIACPEYGHGDLFKKIFAFFTQTAIDLKLYSYVDYSKNPVVYCGLPITDSILRAEK